MVIDIINRDYKLYERAFKAVPGQIDYSRQVRRQKEYRQYEELKEKFIGYIKESARMGCEAAKKFMADYK